MSLRELLRGGESGYTEVLQQTTGSLNIKKLLSVKGSQIFPVRNLALLSVW